MTEDSQVLTGTSASYPSPSTGKTRKISIFHVSKNLAKTESECSVESTEGSGTGKTRKISVFRVKKHVASKVGDTKLGRTALIKMAGSSGDDLINSLKSAVTKLDGREKAKELKKNTLKWVLKASMLWKHKDLSADTIKPVRTPAQLAAEILMQVHSKRKCASRDVDPIHEKLVTLTDKFNDVFAPLSQDKNVEKLCSIVSYYGSKRFLNHLLNDHQCEEESAQIAKALEKMLKSVPRMLDTEKDLLRYKYIYNIKGATFVMCLGGFPEITCNFQEFLNQRSIENENSKHKHSLRFLTAEREYARVENKSVRIERAKNIYRKYLRKQASHQIDISSDDVLITGTFTEENITTGRIDLFQPITQLLHKQLTTIFEDEYLQGPMYQQLCQKLEEEEKVLKKYYGNNISYNSVNNAG
eukprot:CAMPEP_0204828944 /NCGR_PEP_ID=MMETSP1346-20131115/6913_1 /ASSEMBLY_ACC=CAM_ASM_000771 /TAXON_ID=215587 /ORGANISM="Aplanochytrium stocchinoi, Strain GSBS06" /LENGTH=413 /DNA_ID=CAMNT_0051958363 /DNA_START=245 /DNA_END=1486 /DNA_ORIENTATION=+